MADITNRPVDPNAADVDKYPQSWEDKWTAGKTMWDQGKVHPSLVELLESDESDKLGVPRKGWAFVPGCGQGYDVDLFARRGLDSIGLDIAPTGVESANKWLQAQSPRPAATSEAVLGDFFTYKPKEDFDLIYDYTFLCALPPKLRTQWGERMSALTKNAPTSRLITLMYPLNGNPPPFGPPFSLSEEVYDEVLGKDWECIYKESIKEEYKRANSPPGGQKLAVWKRK